MSYNFVRTKILDMFGNEIKKYTLEVGQKVFENGARFGNSWYVCASEPDAVGTQQLYEIGGRHGFRRWNVGMNDRSVKQIFGIGLYYDDSGERVPLDQIAKYKRDNERQTRWDAYRKAQKDARDAQEREALRQQYKGVMVPLDEVDLANDRAQLKKNILAYFKLRFPGVKFSVRRSSWSQFVMTWTDGPTLGAVEKVASIWHDHTFNGYEDYNEYTPSNFNKVFGGLEFGIQCSRRYSDKAWSEAEEKLFTACPALRDEKERLFIGRGQAALDWAHSKGLTASDVVGKAALDYLITFGDYCRGSLVRSIMEKEAL